MKKKTTVDMTVGSPLRYMVKFTLPLLLGNLFQQLYNMVDSVVVGNYVGPDALAAVGACGSMNFLFVSLSTGLATGIGILVSQFFGAGDEKRVRKAIANAVYVLFGVAMCVSILGVLFCPQLLALLQTPESVIGNSVIYMRTACAGMIFVTTYNGMAALLRALGDSRTPLYFLIMSSVINVVLDLVFVLRFGLGVFGVAIATIIAQAFSAIACIIYAYKKISYFRLRREHMKPDRGMIVTSFRLGVPIALQNSMIAVSCMALQGVVNTFGETVMAAYTIIGRIEQIVQQPYSSLAMALTTYSGQNIGAGNTERVKKGFRQATLMALIFSLCLIPIAYLLGEQIIGIFVKDAEVIRIGTTALRINSLCYFALGMIYVPRGVLNGCGDSTFALINGIVEVVCRISFSQILTAIPVLGFWGIWLTTGATWVTTALICVARYMKGKWKVLPKQHS